MSQSRQQRRAPAAAAGSLSPDVAAPPTRAEAPAAPIAADHRRVVRDEEGRGQRQDMQPGHLGAPRKAALAAPPVASCSPSAQTARLAPAPRRTRRARSGSTRSRASTAAAPAPPSSALISRTGERPCAAGIICFSRRSAPLTATSAADVVSGRSSFETIQTKWIKKVADEAENGCHICLVGTKGAPPPRPPRTDRKEPCPRPC